MYGQKPKSVWASHVLWVGAIVAAIVELLTRLMSAPAGLWMALSEGATEVTVRCTAYAVLLSLSLLMLSGRSWSRWALLVIFGGLGTLSLVVEPVQWLLEGGSISHFIATADISIWVITVSRVAHVACVWAAVIAMFGPDTADYFVGPQKSSA
ncbi:hypothetical protein ABIB57_002108 [Devosia sp. UYZn731]|uniref:hypothetical protein n=1 Tax=Devosia sp. UYZn731 TaxID=3156345 RepID=UPI003399F45D